MEKKDRRRLLSPNSKPYQAVSLADLEFSKVYLPLAPVWKNACPVSYRLHIPFLFRRKEKKDRGKRR
jgi:hypothetical protein